MIKYIILFVSCSTVFGQQAFSIFDPAMQAPHVSENGVVMSGLVRWWKLNEPDGNSICSVSGNVLTNTGTVSVPGKFGNALAFDGSSSVCLGANIPDLNTGPFSISLWVAKTNSNPTGWVFNQWDSSSGPAIFYDHSFLTFEVGNYEEKVSAYITSGTQYHVVVTATENPSAVYTVWFNGMLANTGNSRTRVNSTASHQLSIGGPSEGGISAFGGIIDDIRIYNRVLSTTEIQSLYINE